jgi:hypothetical protein
LKKNKKRKPFSPPHFRPAGPVGPAGHPLPPPLSPAADKRGPYVSFFSFSNRPFLSRAGDRNRPKPRPRSHFSPPRFLPPRTSPCCPCRSAAPISLSSPPLLSFQSSQQPPERRRDPPPAVRPNQAVSAFDFRSGERAAFPSPSPVVSHAKMWPLDPSPRAPRLPSMAPPGATALLTFPDRAKGPGEFVMLTSLFWCSWFGKPCTLAL